MAGGSYSVYLVRCANGTLYTGIATDVARRFREHQAGHRGAKYLRGRGPLELVFAESIGDRAAASRAEHRIKKLDRWQKEALVAGKLSLGLLLAPGAGAVDQASGAASG